MQIILVADQSNYAKDLTTKCKSLIDKIVLYEGGVYEWGLLSLLFPDVFLFMNKNTNMKLSEDEIRSQLLNMKHRDESIKQSLYQDIILNSQQNKNFYKNLFNSLQLNKLNQLNQLDSHNSHKYNTMNNKVCVVTGGTSGLGLEVVKKLLDNGAKHVTFTHIFS